MYQAKRTTLFEALNGAGFYCRQRHGAYYIMADVHSLGFSDDFAAADFMLNQVGVAAVPGSSFYQRAELGRRLSRFTFSKGDRTLDQAAQRLLLMPEKLCGYRR